MTIEPLLYAVLQPVFGDNIYPVRHPDPDGSISSVSDSFAIYTKIGGQSFNTLDGDAGISRVRMQISIYAVSYDALKTLERAVNTAMQAANQVANGLTDITAKYNTLGSLVNVSSTVPTDGYESDTSRFYCHMDFHCFEKV